MPITASPEEAISYTWRQEKAITPLLHLGEGITRSEELYHQHFMQLKLTNSFEFFFPDACYCSPYCHDYLGEIPASISCRWVAFIPQVEKAQLIYCGHNPYRAHPCEQLINLNLGH